MSDDSRPGSPPGWMRKVAWTRAEFASLDFEATGLDFARDTVISFGVVPIRAGRIVMGEAVYELVDPDVPPSPGSIVVHGLRFQDLAGAAPLDEAKEILAGALSGRLLVTWYGSVEAAFLDKVFGGGRRAWLKRIVDVRKLVMALERLEGTSAAAEEYTLEATSRRYAVPVASPHHALDDALVTAQLFLIVASRLAERGYSTVKRLLAETRVTAVLQRPRAPA